MSYSSSASLVENKNMALARSNPATNPIQFDLSTNDFEQFIKSIYDTPIGISWFLNPRDWIASLMLFPIKFEIGVNGYLRFATNQIIGEFKVGSISQQRTFQCVGSYLYTPKFKNFADYNGYTKLLMYLPYYGYTEISPNDVINRWINVFIQIDTLSGQACYYICSSTEHYELGAVNKNLFDEQEIIRTRILSVHTFQLGSEIPLGSTNAAEIKRNVALGVVKIAGTAAMTYAFGAAGLTSSTTVSSLVEEHTKRNPKTGRQILSSRHTKDDVRVHDASNQNKMHGISNCFETAMDTLNSAYLRGNGDLVNNPNLLLNGSQSIQLIRLSPKIKETLPAYNKLYGKPLGEVRTLQNITGYTEISNVHIEGELFENATAEEIESLESLLMSGIIL